MLNIKTTGSSEIHLGHLHLILTEGSSGARAAMPADPPSWLQLHDDESENEGWSS
jgi:hypothetical protein